jgi:hypothetical protein
MGKPEPINEGSISFTRSTEERGEAKVLAQKLSWFSSGRHGHVISVRFSEVRTGAVERGRDNQRQASKPLQ